MKMNWKEFKFFSLFAFRYKLDQLDELGFTS